MRTKWLALVLAGMMCVGPALGIAEGAKTFDASQVAPLLNAVTSAALGAEDVLESISADEALTEEFVKRLMTALMDNGLAADKGSLGNLIAMPLPDQELSSEAAVKHLTLQVLTADVNEDGDAVVLVGDVMVDGGDGQTRALDQRAVVELHRDAASPVGWKLYRFSLGDALIVEELTGAYFAERMIEYLNAACGYSIQYPAVFTENMIVETPNGIQAALPDESASFSVTRMDNSEGLTIDALLAREQATDASAVVSVDEVTGAGKSVVTDEEGVTHVAMFLVTEAYIYEAELNYRQDLAADYADYVNYMINSFSADELGRG